MPTSQGTSWTGWGVFLLAAVSAAILGCGGSGATGTPQPNAAGGNVSADTASNQATVPAESTTPPREQSAEGAVTPADTTAENADSPTVPTETAPADESDPTAEDTAPGDASQADVAADSTEPAEPAENESASQAVPGDVAGTPSRGQQLYLQHCAACHGEKGDGQGLAARFLYPRPRDFTSGRFRLVSTKSNVSTAEDILAVILRGMPGSSMPPWAHLNKADQDALVQEVRRLRRQGAEAQYVAVMREDGMTDEEISAPENVEQMNAYLDELVSPGETSEVPAIPDANEDLIARGKAVYTLQGCQKCHGETGKGDGAERQVDLEGYVTSPRDFTAGIFKGGHDSAALYRRIAYGMPGTPMPASTTLSPDDTIALVHYVRSLSTEEQRQANALKREAIRVTRVDSLPDISSETWLEVPPVSLGTMPLWWRAQFAREVTVQAVHDGGSIAIRLTWEDPTQDTRAIGADEFEDMAGVELYQGPAEPFFGKGADGYFVDIWQWRGGMADSGEDRWQSDEYPFDTDYYKNRPGAEHDPDFITARAVENPLAQRRTSASNLQAKGPGSTTFYPAIAQNVTATAVWNDNHWTALFVRSLDVNEGEGLPLVSGQTVSAAFAIWDGTAHDRAAQKTITLWNDLILE